MRKRILLILCCLLFIPCATAMQTYDPCIRSAPLVDTAKFPPPLVPPCERVVDSYFDDAVLIGCSLMTGVELNGGIDNATFVARVGMSPQGAVHNFDYKIGDRRLTMADYVITLAPAKLYIMLGSNGVDFKRPSDVLLDMNDLLNHLITQLPDTLIYVISIPPVTPKVREKYPSMTDAKVAEYNLGLQELAARHNIYYLDIYTRLLGEDGHTARKYAAGDGYHLSLEGYKLVVDTLYTHALPIGGAAETP